MALAPSSGKNKNFEDSAIHIHTKKKSIKIVLDLSDDPNIFFFPIRLAMTVYSS